MRERIQDVGLDAAGIALLASSDLATRLTGLDRSHNPPDGVGCGHCWPGCGRLASSLLELALVVLLSLTAIVVSAVLWIRYALGNQR